MSPCTTTCLLHNLLLLLRKVEILCNSGVNLMFFLFFSIIYVLELGNVQRKQQNYNEYKIKNSYLVFLYLLGKFYVWNYVTSA